MTENKSAEAVAQWRYSINYGPEGEANYAMVYDATGELVGNLKTHHAIAVCNAFAALRALPGVVDDAIRLARYQLNRGSEDMGVGESDTLRRMVAALPLSTEARALPGANPTAQEAVAGWKLVPIEPDEVQIEAMRDAFRKTQRGGAGGMTIDAQWRREYAPEIVAYAAMLAAAPPPPEALPASGGVEVALAKIDEARKSMWKSYRHLAARDVALMNDAYDVVASLSLSLSLHLCGSGGEDRS